MIWKLSQIGVSVIGMCFCLGCAEKAEEPVAVDQVPQVMQEAFQEAQPAVSQQVSQVVSSVQMEDAKALGQLQQLTERPDLTVEQRRAADRAKFALLLQLQEAARNGDQNAEAELERYRARK